MKKYERTLLNNLQSDTSTETLLPNVKQALGNIAHVSGNPLTKTEIKLQVTVGFYTIGAVYTLPGALPLNLQTSLPLYLFGLTDYEAGYLKSSQYVKPGLGWFKGNAFGIYGKDLFMGGFPEMNFRVGDLLLYFTDGIGGNFNAWIAIHCENVAYGTLLQSFSDDLIILDLIRYIVPIGNIAQFNNSITFGTQSLFGKTHTDNVDPRMYITPTSFQQQISDIPVYLPIDKTLFAGVSIDVFCLSMEFVLFVKKVEPLIHN